MLNSQQRSAPQKNIAHTRKANANIFLCCSRAERQPTLLNSGVAKPRVFSTPHYVQASVKPAAARWLRRLLFFKKNKVKKGSKSSGGRHAIQKRRA